jgi:hypothetical protein
MSQARDKMISNADLLISSGISLRLLSGEDHRLVVNRDHNTDRITKGIDSTKATSKKNSNINGPKLVLGESRCLFPPLNSRVRDLLSCNIPTMRRILPAVAPIYTPCSQI